MTGYLIPLGLLLDIVGAWLSLWPLIGMRVADMIYVAERTDQAFWGDENYDVRRSPYFRRMKRDRFQARIGLVLLTIGFSMQIVGWWASRL